MQTIIFYGEKVEKHGSVASCLYMVDSPIRLYRIPMLKKMLNYYHHPTSVDVSSMLVNICPKRLIKWSTYYVHILAKTDDVSIHVGRS